MRFIVVTGLSGAGKTQAIREIEDLGYFCIDNMPPQFIQKFGEICKQTNGNVDNVAFVIDIRGRHFFNYIDSVLNWLHDNFINYKLLFLDCSNEVLVRRYKETRRIHPLSHDGEILDGIISERKKLDFLKKKADFIIDTSNLRVKDLKESIRNFISNGEINSDFVVQVISFGYKYGIPIECDLVFDVRFIENPFYIQNLKKFSGLNEDVKNFVLSKEEANVFLNKVCDLIKFLIPNYIKEGKKQLIIGIGCTGGMHRSVVITEEICSKLNEYNNCRFITRHRDLEKNL